VFYAEFALGPQLSRYVQTIWVFESKVADGAGDMQRIVPDGHPELILHYGDLFHEQADAVDQQCAKNPIQQSRILFAGQISRPLILEPGAACGVIGVRFRPAAASALLGFGMHEATDTRLDMLDVWGRAGENLVDQVHSQRNSADRVAVIRQYLIRKLDVNLTLPDALVTGCVDLLQRSAGQVSIDALARRAGLSGRQLERRFLHHVGVPPRLLASIFRFRRVFESIEQGAMPSARWTAAALQTGYFDQAHMNRDFKRFAGLPPQAFYRGLGGLSAAMIGLAEPDNS